WQGRLARDTSPSDALIEPPGLRWWSARLSLEDGNDFRGLNRVNGQLILDTSCRLGVRTDWNYLHEHLNGLPSDDTFLGDTNVTYRFAEHEQAEFYAGLGFRVLTDP